MKKNVLWAVLVIAAALIQTTFLESITVQGVQPDLTLLLVVYFAITASEERAMVTGLLGGLYQDVASDGVLGHHVLCHVLVGFTAGRISTRLVTEHPAVKAGLVWCAALMHGVLFTSIRYVQDPSMSGLRYLLASVVPRAFYTALVTPFVFVILARMFDERPTTHQEAL